MNGKLSQIPRNGIFVMYTAIFMLGFYSPLIGLLKYALHPNNSKFTSYIVLIPVVSGYLIYIKRKQINENSRISFLYGVPIFVSGIILYIVGTKMGSLLNERDYISLKTVSVVVCWAGGFVFLFGTKSFRSVLFPILFLLFLAPVPTLLMEKAILFLQAASTEVSYIIFQWTGVPIARDGTTFHLPGLSIIIAPECSGMRATLTLFIISILACHLFLRSGWKKTVTVLSTLPITIVGNSLRIVGLTLIGLYLNPNIMKNDSLLHEKGGWLFFLVDLVVLGCIVALLKRREKKSLVIVSG